MYSVLAHGCIVKTDRGLAAAVKITNNEKCSMSVKGIWGRGARLLAATTMLLGAVASWLPAQAGFERYDYDAIGRLIRTIDEQGRATEYQYDAAGNILRVITGSGTAQPPTISSIAPTTIRRGETKLVTLSGANLSGAAVGNSDAGLEIVDVRTTPSQITFTLSISASASLGLHAFVLSSAAGTATASISVAPALPRLTVEPTPLAIPPDNVARPVTLRLSEPDVIDHVVALSASNANMTVTPAQVTFVAGQTQATASVKGVTAGQAELRLNSATLGNTAVPVFITADFQGISTSYAKPLGVVLETATTPGSQTYSPIAGGLLGVVVGSHIKAVAPTNHPVGSEASPLTITGVGLGAAASVTLVPATGVTFGAFTPSADGLSLTLPLTVAANAPLGMRQVVVKDASGVPFPVSQASGDRISIVRQAPELVSLDPLFATRGTTITVTLRGRNLQGMQARSVPSAGIAFGNDPTVSSDGTEAQIRMSVGLEAALGEYVIIASTAGGASSATASSANTFRVVNEIQGAVTPVTSLPLGVVLEDGSGPPSSSVGIASRILGVTLGSGISGLAPKTGVIGTNVTLTLSGAELAAVSAVQFNPATGLSVGAVTPAADGKSVTAELAIALNAPQTVRAVKVLAGSVEVPFTLAGNAQFKVTLPQPEINSLSPIAIQRGQAPQSLLIRGINLKDASLVQVLPPDGMTVSLPTVNAEETEVTVNISAAADAVTGARVVAVTTPGGQSGTEASASNTLTIAASMGATQTPIASPLLGVVLESGTPPVSSPVGPILSPALGVVLEDGAPPPAASQFVSSAALGVAVGPVATGRSPSGFAPGTSGVITVTGAGLDQVTAVAMIPAQGITLGAHAASADGATLNIPLTIAADAQALVPRRIVLSGASGEIPFTLQASPLVAVGPGVPTLDSITPILASQGDKVTMTIRGANFSGANAVTATPETGITFSNTRTVNAAGTELTVELAVSPDAPLGSRVIRVWVPGAASSDEAVPANSFTVYSP